MQVKLTFGRQKIVAQIGHPGNDFGRFSSINISPQAGIARTIKDEKMRLHPCQIAEQ